MEKEIKKPDKFKIKVENNNGKEIIDFLVEKGYANEMYLSGDSLNYYGYDSNKNDSITIFSSSSNYKEYTLEEFKKLFVNNNNLKKNCNTIDFKNWRLATVEEIKAYNNGITNINDMIKSKYDYEVVHCTTQKEWDFILSKFNPRNLRNKDWNYNKNNSLIILKGKCKGDSGCYCKLNGATCNTENSLIYSFQEWCDKFNHKPSFLNEELSELPEKWCISRNLSTENNKIVTDWVNEKYNTGYSSVQFKDDWYGINNKSCIHNSLSNLLNKGYTEITFKQFEKWVLNKDNMNNQSKFKIGDKVCIPRTKKGDPWYKNNDQQLDDYNEDYFIIKLISKYNIELRRADNKNFFHDSFYEYDLVPYVENETKEKWIPKVGDYIYANANIKGYGSQVTKIDRIHWDSNEYFYCVCKFKNLDGTLHPCLNTNWNYQVDNINRFLRPATKEEIYNYEKEQLLLEGEPVIQEMEFEWHVTEFNETKKSYEQAELNQQLKAYPLTPKESYNTKKLPTKSWY